MTLLFGYGSLINPASITARHHPEMLDAVYGYDDPTDDQIRIPETRQRWQELSDQVSAIPVRVSGFGRYYSARSPRGGSMLELYPGEGIVNGVIYTGLDDETIAAVTATESGLRPTEIDPDRIMAYPPAADSIDTAVTAYLPTGTPPPPAEVPGPNTTYHRRIRLGVMELLGQAYGEGFPEVFWAEFLASTQRADGDDWRPLSAMD